MEGFRLVVILLFKSLLSVDLGIILFDVDLFEGICGDSELFKNIEVVVLGFIIFV